MVGKYVVAASSAEVWGRSLVSWVLGLLRKNVYVVYIQDSGGNLGVVPLFQWCCCQYTAEGAFGGQEWCVENFKHQA